MSSAGRTPLQSCHHHTGPGSYEYLNKESDSPGNGPFPTGRNQKSDIPSPGFSACFPKVFLLKSRIPVHLEPTCDDPPRRCASGFQSLHCPLTPACHESGQFSLLFWRRQWLRRRRTYRLPLQQNHNAGFSRTHPQFHQTALNLFHFKGSGHYSGTGAQGCGNPHRLPHIGADWHDPVIGMGYVGS